MHVILYQAIEYVSLQDMQNICLIDKAVYEYCKEWKTYLMKRLIKNNFFQPLNKFTVRSFCGNKYTIKTKRNNISDPCILFKYYLHRKRFFDLFSNIVTRSTGFFAWTCEYIETRTYQFDVAIKELEERIQENPTAQMDWAITRGKLGIVKRLHAKGKSFKPESLITAINDNHFKVAAYALSILDDNNKCLMNMANVVDWASGWGYAKFVEYLLDNGFDCTTDAMDLASEKGHIRAINILHRRGKTCTTWAMNWAAENGHIETVRLLHFLGKKCTDYALNLAVENGHFIVVEFLVWVVKMKYTKDTIRLALDNGKLRIGHYFRNIDKLKRKAKIQGNFTVVRTETVNLIKPWDPPRCTVRIEKIESSEGHFKLKKYFDVIGQLSTGDAVKWASENNHPDLVEYLQGIEVV